MLWTMPWPLRLANDGGCVQEQVRGLLAGPGIHDTGGTAMFSGLGSSPIQLPDFEKSQLVHLGVHASCSESGIS